MSFACNFWLPHGVYYIEMYINQSKKIMKNYAIMAAIVLALAFGACTESTVKAVAGGTDGKSITASENIVTKGFAVGDFERISVGGVFKVVYTPGVGKPKVEVRTADNVMPLVSVGVKDGTLQLRLNHNGTIKSLKTLEVSVASPSLSGIALSGAAKGEIGGRLEAKSFEARLSGVSSLEAGKVDADRFEARLSGSSKMTVGNVVAASAKVRASGVSKAVVAVDAGETAMNVSGSAKAVVTGKATKATYSASGASKVAAEGCVASNVVASASGSSKVKCHATGTLKLKRSGVSKISYKGSPRIDASEMEGISKL